MSASFLFLLLGIGLFILSFLMKRRFGMLALGLAAGALISEHWSSTLTPFIAEHGVTVSVPPLEVLVSAVLILLPPVMLLFSGPTYSNILLRIGGSAVFAVLTLTFLLPVFAPVIQFDEISAVIALVIEKYESMIIVIGLALGLVDLFMTRYHKKPRRRPEH